MSGANLALSDGVASDTHVDRPRNRVYVDSRMRSARDRDVPSRAEQRLDLDCRAAHLDSVENASRPWDGNGREYAKVQTVTVSSMMVKACRIYPSAGLAG